MVQLKQREERGRSIRAHILTYIKTGRVDELDKAQDELAILRQLERIPPPEEPVVHPPECDVANDGTCPKHPNVRMMA